MRTIINKQHRKPRGLALALAGVVSLLISGGSAPAALDVYVTNDKNAAQTEPPPPNGGNGWLRVANIGRGMTVNAGETVWLACRNGFNPTHTKVWTVKLI